MSKLGQVVDTMEDKEDPKEFNATKGHEATVSQKDDLKIQGLSGQDVFNAIARLALHLGEQLKRNASTISLSLISLSLGLFLWHLATAYKLDFYINFQNVPSPSKVFTAFWTHLGDPEFYIHIGVSMQRILTGYITAAVIGIAAGVLMGRSRIARSLIYPYIEVLRPIPAVAWIPLAILMWPTEEASIIYITLLGALFPIVLNTLHGVEQTPEVLVRAAKSLGASRLQIFWHVILPAALPSIAAGLAIGMGVSWFSLLAGEIISGQYGIGYFTWDAYSLINYPDIVVGMLVIGGLGTLSTYAVKLGMQPLLAWQKRAR
ncbi:MAG: ABC transporter permease [Roseibium sp.]|uniref:ABC transporter permease n=1 Tax=Roseibium sp. TaxID=1936156 RepID=UPI001B0C37EC|nr:ABC transporter permease [Roseibium sp.]MBO6893109.1 ABC transporter permease [Roseibium sp.]MBO6932067.1 ABC transporter permease [Roseibium sp.]